MKDNDEELDEHDEEMIPHPFERRIEDGTNWCQHCEYHREHTIHASTRLTAPAQD